MDILRRALDGPRLVRFPPDVLLPVEPGDRRLLLALTLAAEPAVSWRPEGDAREHDVIFPSVIPSAQLIRPLGSIVDAMRRARVHPSRVNAFLADPDPSAAVQLSPPPPPTTTAIVHRHLAEPSDDDALGLLVVTAAPELDKEARVVSFARAAVAYGHATLSDFIAARFKIQPPPDPSAFALDAADASGAVVAEIVFCDDDARAASLARAFAPRASGRDGGPRVDARRR